ncbi:MAG: SPOR domain-containing protein [Gammaproteobacteria bacterium]|nr:SPOR domain-containing protein [Gammaproteobacteria bacterium]
MSDENFHIELDDDPAEATANEPAFDADSLLVTPALQQRIDLIEHLIDFGRQIIVMVGPSGIGKTNMLHVVANCEHDNWERLHLRGGPTLNAKALAARLNGDIGAEKPASDELDIQLDMLRRRMVAIQRGGHLPVLFLDDADLLPMDAVQFIVELAHTDDPEAELHVVMTATTGRSALVDDLQRLVPNHAPVHVVELPKFNDAQTRALVQKLAETNGHADPVAFADERIAEIQAESAGIPERIQVLARQQLLAAAGAAAPTAPRRKFTLRINPKLVAALGLMGAVVATGYWWAGRPAPPTPGGPHSFNEPQAPVNAPAPVNDAPPPPAAAPAQPLRPGEIAVPLPPPADAAPPAAGGPAPGVPAPAASVTATPLPPPAAAPTEPAANAAPSPEPAKNTVERAPETPEHRQPPPAEPAATSAEKKSATEKKKQRANVQKGAMAAKTAKTKDAPAPTVPSVIAKAAPGTQVIQLFGLRDRTKAQRFIEAHGIGGSASIVASSLNGSPLYVVTYGQYPSRKAAQQALSALPADLKALKPWIRSAASLAGGTP